MFDRFVLLILLFIILVYLSYARNIKSAGLQMVLSGEKEVGEPEKEVDSLQKQIQWYTNGMITLGLVLLCVGVFTLKDFASMLK